MTDKVVDLAKGEADIAIHAAEPSASDSAFAAVKLRFVGLYASKSYVEATVPSVQSMNQ